MQKQNEMLYMIMFIRIHSGQFYTYVHLGYDTLPLVLFVLICFFAQLSDTFSLNND
jgi:hypothetical protein